MLNKHSNMVYLESDMSQTGYASLGMSVGIFLIFWAIPASHLASGQDRIVITGKVVDAETNTPLPGVNIFLAYTLLGAATDTTGNYTVIGALPGTHEMIASMVGYEAQMIQVELTPAMTDKQINFRLKPAVYPLSDVTVVATYPRDWKTNIRQFKKVFLGSSPNAKATEISNLYVLNFEREDNKLSARASEPLQIENRALGYRITYILQAFEFEGNRYWYQGKPFFEELEPAHERERQQWQRNRERTFKGSRQHLLWAMVHQRVEEEGFLLRRFYRDNRNVIVPTDPVLVDRILRSTERPYEFAFIFRDSLLVSFQTGRRRKLLGIPVTSGTETRQSYIHLAGMHGIVHETGYLYGHPRRMGTLFVGGYFGTQRVADLLPREYVFSRFSRRQDDIEKN